MAEIIDFGQRLGERNRPDDDCVRIDGFGEPLYLFALGYTMDGRTWAGPEIWAYSFADAEARVRAMRDNLTLVGQIKASDTL